MKLFNDIAGYVLAMKHQKVKKATAFIDKNLVAKITLRPKKLYREPHVVTVLTVGRPNFAERKFIKDCIKAGEKFPIRKLQLKHYAAKTARIKAKA